MNVSLWDYSLSNHSVQNNALEKPIPKGIFKYTKGEKRTQDLIPTHKEYIGHGINGKVYVHRDNNKLAVKKSTGSLKNEFEIGSLLNHPCLVKSHALFIKTLVTPETEEDSDTNEIHKMVMDKIEGDSLSAYKIHSNYIPNDKLEKLLYEALDCTQYLFEQRICWGDLNVGNVFITHDNHLMICDFGFWEKDVFDKTKLILGLMSSFVDLIEGIIERSVLFNSFEGDSEELMISILFPKDFIFMKNLETFYSELTQKVKNQNKEELKNLLNEYLQHLLIALKTHL